MSEVFLILGTEEQLTPLQHGLHHHGFHIRKAHHTFELEHKMFLAADIQRDTFLGNQYDYQVRLGGQELRVERDALDVLSDPTHYAAGQEVGLRFLNVKFYEEEAQA